MAEITKHHFMKKNTDQKNIIKIFFIHDYIVRVLDM